MGERWMLYVPLCDRGSECKAEMMIKRQGEFPFGNRPKLVEPRDFFHPRDRNKFRNQGLVKRNLKVTESNTQGQNCCSLAILLLSWVCHCLQTPISPCLFKHHSYLVANL